MHDFSVQKLEWKDIPPEEVPLVFQDIHNINQFQRLFQTVKHSFSSIPFSPVCCSSQNGMGRGNLPVFR